MARLELETSTQDAVAVVATRGELDIAGTVALEEAIGHLADDPVVLGVVVDLSQLTFMDSSGLRALVLAGRSVEASGRRFALVPGGEPVQRVFEITRMTERLSWVASPGDLLRDDAGEPA
jgi:anti-anti-sigma factor